MKVLITYNSIHRGNTEKIAKAMASAIDAELIKYDEVDEYSILDYDLIGFGSGIYYGKPNKELIEFIDRLPDVKKGRHLYLQPVVMKIRNTAVHWKRKFQNMVLMLLENSHARHLMYGAP